jgi:hypothetical protein
MGNMMVAAAAKFCIGDTRWIASRKPHIHGAYEQELCNGGERDEPVVAEREENFLW